MNTIQGAMTGRASAVASPARATDVHCRSTPNRNHRVAATSGTTAAMGAKAASTAIGKTSAATRPIRADQVCGHEADVGEIIDEFFERDGHKEPCENSPPPLFV